VAEILVIDDEADERDLMISWLEEAGHVVRNASSGESGVDMLKSIHIDLAVIDVFMPGMGGIRTIRKIRTMIPAIPVIAISGYLQDDVALDVRTLGVVSLEKPFLPEQLIKQVAECLFTLE